jgi:hypothetical protein
MNGNATRSVAAASDQSLLIFTNTSLARRLHPGASIRLKTGLVNQKCQVRLTRLMAALIGVVRVAAPKTEGTDHLRLLRQISGSATALTLYPRDQTTARDRRPQLAGTAEKPGLFARKIREPPHG